MNVSARQLVHGDFAGLVAAVLKECGLPPENLELEVREQGFISNMEESVAVLSALRERGVTVAIDDFGTGYSSLRYLQSLPIDKLKIDRSFFTEIERSGADQAIVRAIIELGNAFGMTVVAEGVERATQAEWLDAQGCSQLQGFYFGSPLAADDALDVMS